MRLKAACRIEKNPTANPAAKLGGADRTRTDDIRLAKAALSQLSYSPWYPEPWRRRPSPWSTLSLVGLGRLELPTSRLSGVRSNH